VVMTTFLCSLQDWKNRRRERPSEMEVCQRWGRTETKMFAGADVDVLDDDDDESM
jgi:hypothetical protein